MRRNDFSQEFVALAMLLELRPGDVALDAQTEADMLLPILHHEVTDGGRSVGKAIGMAFGRAAIQESRTQADKMGLNRAEILAGHPSQMPFKEERFNGVVLRHDMWLPRLQPVFEESWRVSKQGGRIVARHTEWDVRLKSPTPLEQEMIDALKAPCGMDGRQFFSAFSGFRHNAWREVRFDVFTIACRDPRVTTRFKQSGANSGYDWRTLMRQHLDRARRVTPIDGEWKYTAREILSLIERLEQTRGSKVTVDRYLALGIKR